VLLSESHLLTASRRVRVLTWLMKKYEARPQHSHGFRSIAQTCLFLDSGDLDSPMAVHSLPLQTHPGTADFTSGFDESCNKGFWASIAGAHLYPPRQCSARLRTGYLVMDFIEPQQGSMLRNKWPTADPDRRQNLFRTLANILLDLMKVPLPRIGSFTVLDTGEVTLTGRPLTAALALFEAEENPSDMPPGTTYPSTDSYVEDLLNCHETRLRDQPNAVEEENDAVGQLATVVVLRAVKFDDQFNITSIVDLEWSCSLPVEMHQPQFWLSGHVADDFLGDGRAEKEATFMAAYNEFLDILRSEQKSRGFLYRTAFDPAQIIQSALEKKSHWYFAAVSHPRPAYGFLVDHIQPIFAPSHTDDIDQAEIFQNTFLPYYAPNALKLVERKIEEKAKYDLDLRALVDANADATQGLLTSE
jgi:hypothetical protein